MADDTLMDRRFIFNGSAVAFGGRIRRPEDVHLNTAAVAYLPVTGGLSEHKVSGEEARKHHYKDFIRFDEASSRAVGDFSDVKKAVDFTHGNWGQIRLPAVTTVETCLAGLHIDASADEPAKTPRRVFHAGKLELHMQTTTSSRTHQAAIRTFSVAFHELTIASGDAPPLAITVHTAADVFTDNDTKAKLIDRYAKDGEFREKYASCFHPLGEPSKNFISNMVGKHEIPFAEQGPIVATFVTGIDLPHGTPDGVQKLGNRLIIPGLGRIYFGEIIIDDHYQRATLLRFELGSNGAGSVSAGEASSNGTWHPPQTT